ncbi:MAG: hypothetical protein JJ899_05110 [Alphaproteobacteria bacterium]|nr:hypothetical protein [Alphaproteobacteria bacterium]
MSPATTPRPPEDEPDIRGADADAPEGAARPVLHAPKVNTMRMGHIPLTIFGTSAVAFLFATAFGLGIAPPVASVVLMLVLFVLAAVVRVPNPAAPGNLDQAMGADLTTGTRFTIIRVIIACTLGGLALLPAGIQPPDLLWSLAALGLTGALVESCDNWLARVTGSDSAYSERLATMTAALFALVLALLPLQLGLLGQWVVIAGVLGFADAAIAPRGPRGQLPLWQVWSRLAMRVLLLATLVPAIPADIRWIPAVLALGLGGLHVGYALKARLEAAKRDGRSIFDA